MKIAGMRIYFYHTQDIQMQLSRFNKGEFPGHLLYGATRLKEHGIDVIWHRFIPTTKRLKIMLLTAWRVLRLRHQINAVYATHYRGIEISEKRESSSFILRKCLKIQEKLAISSKK